MQHPTHEAVARRARTLWENAGRPTDRDPAIWLEAEQQLVAEASSKPAAPTKSPSSTIARIRAETAAESVVENHLSPAPSEEEAIKAAVPTRAARAPVVPRHPGPKAKPAESGKPLWKQPHSS